MDAETLIELVVPTAAIIGATVIVVRLLAPFAEALAERLRPRPQAVDDGLHAEVRSLRGRLDALERQHDAPLLLGESASMPHQGGS
jgi:hypothetical protein